MDTRIMSHLLLTPEKAPGMELVVALLPPEITLMFLGHPYTALSFYAKQVCTTRIH
jgi:hypothetical protein